MVQHRSRQLGFRPNPIRLQNRVHLSSSKKRTYEGNSCSTLSRSEIHTGKRNSWPAPKRGNRRCALLPVKAPLQIQFLSSSEKASQLETDSQLKTSKQEVHKTTKVPDGNPSINYPYLLSRNVGLYDRPKGRLSPHTDSPTIPALSSLPVQTRGLQVPGSPVRIIHSAESVHQGVKSCSSIPPPKRDNSFRLHRRLAHSGGIPTGMPRENVLRYSCPAEPRVDNQFRQVELTTFPVRNLSGSSSRLRKRLCPADSGASHCDLLSSKPSSSSSFTPSPFLVTVSRPSCQLGGNSPVLQALHEAHPISSTSSLQSKSRPSIAVSSVVSGSSSLPEVVDSSHEPIQRKTIRGRQTFSTGDYRCLQRRLGRNLGVQVNVGPMVFPGEISTHQCSRASRCEKSHSNLGQRSQGPQCHRPFGQLYYCVIPESSRGDEIFQPLPSNLGVSAHMPVSQHLDQSNPPTGRTERYGRRPVQRPFQSERMVPQPVLGRPPLPDIRTSARGPLCVAPQLQAANVRVQESSPSCVGDRRPFSRLESSHGVCVPPDSSPPESTSQTSSFINRNDSSGPLLAETVVVSAHPPHVGRPTVSFSGGPSTTIPSQTENSAPRPSVPSSGCLEVINQRFVSKGLSQRAAELASHSRRKSTIATYDSRLEKFYSWSKDNAIDPVEASVDELCSFFVALFDEGKQVSTIRNYRSAIAAIHSGFQDGSSIGTNHTITMLLRGMFHQRPPRQRLAPSWSINDVLSHLSKEPFEPIHNSPLDALTKKTVFLVAVASARRRGEIHALSVDPGFIRFSPEGVYLLPNPNFLAKNQSESFSPAPIFLPTMSSASSMREDRFVCPVRALKWYIEKTKALRKSNALFLIPRSPYTSASKDTISRWLVELISLFASPDDRPRAHDVRACAASAAWFRGVPLTDILRAASWKTPSTFVSRYLTNVVSADTRFARSILRGSSSSQNLPPSSRC